MDQQNAVEKIYIAWDRALEKKSVEDALSLYAPDATIESPLVRALLGSETGVCRGHDEIRHFIEIVFRRTPTLRRHFRTGYFTDGKKLMWEYPRETPHGEQMDFVEVMELHDGLIRRHRVYWGWFGLEVLKRNEYSR